MKASCSVVIGLLFLVSCGSVEGDQGLERETVRESEIGAEEKQDAVWEYYRSKNLDSLPSESSGTPGNGKLKHGRRLFKKVCQG